MYVSQKCTLAPLNHLNRSRSVTRSINNVLSVVPLSSNQVANLFVNSSAGKSTKKEQKQKTQIRGWFPCFVPFFPFICCTSFSSTSHQILEHDLGYSTFQHISSDTAFQHIFSDTSSFSTSLYARHTSNSTFISSSLTPRVASGIDQNEEPPRKRPPV